MDLRKFKPGVIAKSAPRATDDEIISYDTSQAPFWTIHPDGGKPIRYAKKGIASEAGAKAFTIIEVWKSFLDKKGDLLAMATEWPTPQLSKETGQAPPPLPLNEWKSWNWKQYYDETASISKLIVSVGFAPLDAVIVYGFNSPYWFMGFLSGILAGGKGSGIYPSDSKEQVVYKTVHGKGSVIFLESAKLLEMYQSTIDELPYIKAIIVWTPSSSPLPESITRSDGSVVKVYSWETAAEEGKKLDGAVLDERAKNVQPHHCAALIYTSGTTGNPKAVMISHDNILFESRSVLLTCCPFFGENSTDRERCISYLPLSHVAGLLVDVFLPMLVSAFRPGSSATYFARPYDLKIGSLGARIKAVRPTSFIGVPRVWEKFADKIKEIGAQTKGLKKQIAAWAKAKGLKYHEARQIGGSASTPFMFGTAEKIVLSKVKAAIGLDQCKFAFTGAAPIMLETLQYFGSLGLNINEVYGMSECCGASTWSVDECHLWGTVGFPLPGTEVKIFKVDEKDINKKTECPDAKDPFKATDAEQGEICFRGRHIMLGYLANPDLGEEHVQEIMKKNREAIDDDGWLHSGDMGCKSKTGMIKITGRYKELIIGAGGENIAPVPIEDYLKKICKPISNAVMVGNQRKFNVLLVTLKAKGATGELPGTDDLDGPALDVDKECTKISQAVKSKAFIQLITAAIKETNENGAVCPSNAARIQKFTILPNDFSVQNEEITPSLKLKRGFVEKKYKDLIDKMMDSEEVYVPFS